MAKADVTPIVEIAQSKSGRSALRPCASPAHLTCIESLSAILPNGTTNEFKLLQAPTGSYLDSKNQVTENSLSRGALSMLMALLAKCIPMEI